MERGGDGRSARWQADLPAPEAIGAGGRQARGRPRLGARKIASTTAPVIFENRLATSLLSPLIGAISGPAIARGISFLKDRLGKPVFAKGINIIDDPHRLRGLGSSPFDDEGVANRKARPDRRRRADHLAAEQRLRPPARPGDHRPRLARPGRPARRLDPST